MGVFFPSDFSDLSASDVIVSALDDSEVLGSGLGGGWDVVVPLGVVDDLGLDGDILDPLVGLLDGLLDHDGLLNFPLDVLHLGLNSVVIGDGPLIWHSLISDNLFVFNFLVFNGNLENLLHLFVFNIFLLEGDVFDSALNGDIVGNSSGSFSSNGSFSVSSLLVDNFLSVTLNCILGDTLVFVGFGGGGVSCRLLDVGGLGIGYIKGSVLCPGLYASTMTCSSLLTWDMIR